MYAGRQNLKFKLMSQLLNFIVPPTDGRRRGEVGGKKKGKASEENGNMPVAKKKPYIATSYVYEKRKTEV